MPATHNSQITREAIQSFLDRIVCASVTWAGRMPADCEDYDATASDKATSLTVEQVQAALDFHDLYGDTPEDEIQMAASIAAEPADLPEGGMVELVMD